MLWDTRQEKGAESLLGMKGACLHTLLHIHTLVHSSTIGGVTFRRDDT
jgi:hypothetical protein